MAAITLAYTPRDPSAGVLYQIVHDHLETFRSQAACLRDGEGLPRFVDEEFRAFLRCGWLAGGFARFRCADCGLDRLVAFSCKGRGFCPSCGGRRMAERAAHLVDRVLPDVPVRQWVLSLPPRVRYALAWDHDACRGMVQALLQAVERHACAQAATRGVVQARGGGVAIIQRFGALNLNLHVHALVLDGVYARDPDGRLRFHAAPAVTAADVADVLAAVVPAITRVLVRRGYVALDTEVEQEEDRFAKAAPLLAGLAAASAQGRVALGAPAGAGPCRLGARVDAVTRRESTGACHARWDAFDLHAGVRVPAGQRDRLERVCRYALRPPLSEERLALNADGEVVLHMRRPWADGTTALVFAPTAFLERLAVLVPRPRINLVLYYGVLGARILLHLGLPTEVPAPRASRAPPTDWAA